MRLFDIRRWSAAAACLLLTACGTIDRVTGVRTACELRAHGAAARAEILAVWETGWSVNDEPVIGLRVRVEPSDRPPFEAVIAKALVDRVHVPQFQPGAIVPVVFDAADPAKVGLDVYACAAPRAGAAT